MLAIYTHDSNVRVIKKTNYKIKYFIEQIIYIKFIYPSLIASLNSTTHIYDDRLITNE